MLSLGTTFHFAIVRDDGFVFAFVQYVFTESDEFAKLNIEMN